MADILLNVEDMKIYYPVAGKKFGTTDYVKAVDGVSFQVERGEVFGIVGESGCGKSTLGRGICKLEQPTGGKVVLDGEDISSYNNSQMRADGVPGPLRLLEPQDVHLRHHRGAADHPWPDQG